MSTAAEHQRKTAERRWKHVRRAKELWATTRIILRPLVLPIIGLGGIYVAVEELKRSPLHHNTIIWVLGFGLAAFALLGAYKEVRRRMVLRRWLNLDDREELQNQLPDVRKAVADLPPWHRARYLAKRARIEGDQAARPRSPHSAPTLARPLKAKRSLGGRLRIRAAFVLSVLVLGPLGAFAFVQWLQIVVSEFGNPTPWLVTWAFVGTYFVSVGVAVAYDALRARHRRRKSPADDS